MARVDVTQPLLSFTGEPIQANGKPLTLRNACCNVLGATFDGEKLEGKDKVARYALAQRIHSELSPFLTAEEIALLKKLLDVGYGVLVVGAAWTILDPAPPMAQARQGEEA